jgi:Spy/CpxP family protein refolding chaperone
MRRRIPLALAALLCLAGAVRAQPPGPPPGQPPGPDPIAQNVFPPELIMRYAGDIGLDERQRAAVKDAVQKAQSRFLDGQWQMQEEGEKMVRLLQARPVDEAAVLAQADRVMNLEREVKKLQLSLLVRLKNLLTEPQEKKLMELRKRSAGAGS